MLYEKIKKLHSSAYLTLMSIVQGVALSFFTYYLLDKLQVLSFPSWVIVFSTILVLILTWFEYIIGITIFVWFHGILDSIIPFSLFMAEIMLIHTMTLDDGSWFFWMSIFSLIALLAFINMYCKAKHHKENKNLLEELGKWHFFPLIYLLISTILFILIWKFWDVTYNLYLTTFALLIIIGYSVRSKMYWGAVIRYAKSSRA